jgi:hypothetical protein
MIAQERRLALAVGADPFLDTQRDRMIELAARHAVRPRISFANMPRPAA